MTDRFDGGDESRVQALMAERDKWKAKARSRAPAVHAAIAERNAAVAENERLRETLIAARDLFTRMEMPSYAAACDEALDA